MLFKKRTERSEGVGGDHRQREHFLKRAASRAGPGDVVKLKKVADDIGLGVDELRGLLPGWAESGWVTQEGERWKLTRKGWEEGRHFLRAHRIYESYLAERTGLEPGKWHEEADRLEHELDSEAIDQLARGLNHPRFDPHGDAIPTRHLEMPELVGRLLSQVTHDGFYRIIHLEDEPREPFEQLIRAGLAPGLTVEVHMLSGGRFLVEWAGQETRVDTAQAAAMMVAACDEASPPDLPQGNLYHLEDGQEARIHSLSPALRGLERRRLLDLGFVQGSRVVRESSGAFNGPVRFRVRGTVQALRAEQAKKIFTIEPAGNTDV
jgi:DtxR family Mn-dependent transcriptional regulator